MLWCKAHGVERKGGCELLNFPAAEGDEVDDELKGMTLDGLVEELRRRGGKKQKQATSSFTSKHYCKRAQRWKVQVKHKGINTSLGYFDTEEEAARAYDCVMMWFKVHRVERAGCIELKFPEGAGKVDDELGRITLG